MFLIVEDDDVQEPIKKRRRFSVSKSPYVDFEHKVNVNLENLFVVKNPEEFHPHSLVLVERSCNFYKPYSLYVKIKFVCELCPLLHCNLKFTEVIVLENYVWKQCRRI
jgi:hypothetical protein